VNPQSDESGRHLAETGSVRRRAILVANVSSFDVTEVGESAAEGVKDRGRCSDIDSGCRREKPDPGDGDRRLCLCAKGRCGSKADSAGKNSSATLHAITS